MVRAKLNVRTCTTRRRPIPARGPSGSDGRVKPRRELRYRRSLIYKLPVLRWPGATARYSSFNIPVETGTPPCCRKVRSAPFPPAAKTAPASLLLRSKPNPLRWASVWLAASPPLGRKLFGLGESKNRARTGAQKARRYGRRLLRKNQTFSGSGYSTPKVSTVTFFMR